ncbi:penicillin acylase family protein [Propionibacteriaceae bacterium Y2011]
MRRLHRWLLFVAFVLILALGAMSSLAVVTVRESFPQTNGKITVPAITGTVDVLRDAYGIPHIYADTPEDLFAAQGYVHAQDRFFEMDFRRHITSGRLSELFGESQLETDTYIRTLGWRKVAEEEAAALSGSTKRYLESYAAGVNAWLQTRSGGELSLEYSVLGVTGLGGYQPEPWTVADSLAWFKAMAWNLDGNRIDELERAVVTAELGASRANELWPAPDLDRFAPILTRGAIRNGAFDPNALPAAAGADPLPGRTGTGSSTPIDLEAALPALRATAGVDGALGPVLGDVTDRLGGSNSFVVSSLLSSTGSALLSNDPHLATAMPSTFTQIGLHCTVKSEACPYDVVGFSFSGVPAVVIGHNANIAWGLTTPYVDTQDLFIEQVRGNDVRYGEEYEPLTTRTEQIWVRGEETPHTITVRSSRHGPLLSDVEPQLLTGAGAEPPADGTEYAVALAWTALTPGTTAEALFGLNTALNFADFRKAAQQLTSPSQNLVYADRFGNIGYQLPGAIPTRGKGDGRMPRPGWDPSWDWTGLIPFEQLPWDFNPPSGYIVAANQSIIGPQYRQLLGSSPSYGWRSQPIQDLLESQEQVTPEMATSIFAESTMGVAAELVPTLLRVQVTDGWVRQGQSVLVGWDYRADPDSAAAAYFSVVYKRVLQLTFSDELPPEVVYGSSDRWFSVLGNLIREPHNEWWDDVTTPEVESRDDILLRALTEARKEITSRLSNDPGGWRWGDLHTVELRHGSLGESGIPPIEWVFNRGPLPVGGSTGVINAMSWQVGRGDYTVTTAPTMRMMVDFANVDSSRWINQSGVSGHTSHPNYDDQFPLWVRGEMITMPATRTRVEEQAIDHLELLAIG